jgi:hypothetical protein
MSPKEVLYKLILLFELTYQTDISAMISEISSRRARKESSHRYDACLETLRVHAWIF